MRYGTLDRLGTSRLTKVLPYALLLSAVLMFYRHVLFYSGYILPWDFRNVHLVLASFIADAFRHGAFPLWEPYTYCGRPLFADIQAQLFYPPLLLAVVLSNWMRWWPLYYWLEWDAVLHVFMAGVFTFWLVQRLGARKPAALIGALIFALGGFFTSQAQHLGATNAAAWMPLAWLCVLALRDGLRWRWLAGLAIAFAMPLIGGLPQVTLVVIGSALLLALLLALFRLAPPKVPLAAIACALIAVLLGAVQFLPTAQLTGLSIAQYRADWLGTGGGLTLNSLVSLVLPNHYGIFDLKHYTGPRDPTFMYLYCGISGLMLVLAALIRMSRQTAVFLTLTVLAAVWMLGDSTPICKGAYMLLPQFIRIGIHPEFTMPAFILGMAVLAGLGVNAVLRRESLIWIAMAITAIDLTVAGSGRPMNTASLQAEPGVTADQFDGNRAILERLRLLIHLTRPPSRVDTVSGSVNWALSAPMIQVPTASGSDPLALARPMQLRLAFCQGQRWGSYYPVTNLKSPVLDLANIRYVLSTTPLDLSVLTGSSFTYAGDLPGYALYENRNVMPRFFLVNHYRVAKDLEEAARILRSPDFEPHHEAILEGNVLLPEAPSTPLNGTATLKEYGLRHIVVDIDSPSYALLVEADTNYPGWRAFVDDAEEPVRYADVAFRGVAVPPGHHRVRLEFSPSILWRGILISGVAWLTLVLISLVIANAARHNDATALADVSR